MMKSKWKKVTGGNILLKKGGRRIKYKEVITATEKELGNHISHFEKVSGKEGKQPEAPPDTDQGSVVNDGEPEPFYVIEPLSKGWFNIVSQSGEVMNEKKLRKEEAEEYLKSLNEG